MTIAPTYIPRQIEELLGPSARDLLEHTCQTIPAEQLHLPGPDFVNRIWAQSDRPTPVLRSLQSLFDHGRLAGTGYMSILPVDQGIEHSAGASFAPESGVLRRTRRSSSWRSRAAATRSPRRSGCSARWPARYAHRIPFICKINHNELLTLPEQVRPGAVRHGQAGSGAGRGCRRRDGLLRLRRVATARLQEVSVAFHTAHELGLATVLWCYLRNCRLRA